MSRVAILMLETNQIMFKQMMFKDSVRLHESFAKLVLEEIWFVTAVLWVTVTFMASGSLLLPQPLYALGLVSLHLQQKVTGWMSAVNLQCKQ